MDKQEQLVGLECLADHEEILGQLYEIYSIQQPEHAEFWKRFLVEEEIHSSWIKDLIDEVSMGRVEIELQRFPVELIRDSIEQVSFLKNEAMQGHLSFIDQLKVALDQERELLDKKFFETLESDNPNLKMVLDKLRVATEVHHERLSDELEKQKS